MSDTRLLLVSTELRLAGAERVIHDLATRLPDHGFDVHVASLLSPKGDDGHFAHLLRRAGIPVHPMAFRSKLDVRAVRRFRRLIRDLRPEVVNAHQFHPYMLARLFCPDARRVSTMHVVDRRRLFARRFFDRLTASRDHATVCVSQAVAGHAKEARGVAAPLVIENGVDLQRYRELPSRAEARERLGLPVDGRIVGSVARLDRQKGLDVLIEAVAHLAPKHPDVVLALCGDGPERGNLGLRASSLGQRVRFLGRREDVETVYAALDVFCLPSRWEGFGLAVVEAMAGGLPCLVSDIDSLPEVAGTAAATFPVGDAAALADLIERALGEDLDLSDPRENARRFDIERMVSETAAVLRPS